MRILFLLLYLLVFLPVGLAFRLVGDPLRRKLSRSVTSYWIVTDPAD